MADLYTMGTAESTAEVYGMSAAAGRMGAVWECLRTFPAARGVLDREAPRAK